MACRASSADAANEELQHRYTEPAGAANQKDLNELQWASSPVPQNKTQRATTPEHAMPIQAERRRWERQRQAGLERRLHLLYSTHDAPARRKLVNVEQLPSPSRRTRSSLHQGDDDRFSEPVVRRTPHADRKEAASSANSAAAAVAAATPKEPAQLRATILKGDRSSSTIPVSPRQSCEHRLPGPGSQWPSVESPSGNEPTPVTARAGMLPRTSDSSVLSGSSVRVAARQNVRTKDLRVSFAEWEECLEE
ncbi:hypothetical protein T484DRAFT_1820511 [Baffinella frigidus]|nr:hypothetical protein T484DRAFT_1820511 [Cryptophyta sp. CCMP2293]